MGNVYASLRVSTQKQSTDRQHDIISDYIKDNNITINEWFIDKISGMITTSKRIEYNRMKSVLAKGDTVIFSELERMGRDWDNNIEEYKWFLDNGINVMFIDFPIINIEVTDGIVPLEVRLIKEQMLATACYFAQKEREKISTRTRDGIKSRRKTNKTWGRPKEYDHKAIIDYYKSSSAITYNDVSDKFGISKGAISDIMKSNRVVKTPRRI